VPSLSSFVVSPEILAACRMIDFLSAEMSVHAVGSVGKPRSGSSRVRGIVYRTDDTVRQWWGRVALSHPRTDAGSGALIRSRARQM